MLNAAKKFMLNAEQIRAARSWLGISQEELAQRAGVAKRTIARFELNLSVPYDRTLRDLQSSLEAMGIEFIFEGTVGVGIRVRRSAAPAIKEQTKKRAR
jgi:transcriptional regulator with XRE-family HTH domain